MSSSTLLTQETANVGHAREELHRSGQERAIEYIIVRALSLSISTEIAEEHEIKNLVNWMVLGPQYLPFQRERSRKFLEGSMAGFHAAYSGGKTR
jgi:hypothetical protein